MPARPKAGAIVPISEDRLKNFLATNTYGKNGTKGGKRCLADTFENLVKPFAFDKGAVPKEVLRHKPCDGICCHQVGDELFSMKDRLTSAALTSFKKLGAAACSNLEVLVVVECYDNLGWCAARHFALPTALLGNGTVKRSESKQHICTMLLYLLPNALRPL